jgi:hypothetical protein
MMRPRWSKAWYREGAALSFMKVHMLLLIRPLQSNSFALLVCASLSWYWNSLNVRRTTKVPLTHFGRRCSSTLRMKILRKRWGNCYIACLGLLPWPIESIIRKGRWTYLNPL